MTAVTAINHNNQRVLTTQQLAESYGTTMQVITNNFNRNKERYQIGIHYFTVEDEEKRRLFCENQFDFSNKDHSKFYLWTEKGCFFHAKSLGTDKAWQVYEVLVDTYFRVKELTQNPTPRREASKINISLRIAESVFRELRLPDSGKLSIYSKICKEYGVGDQMLPAYADEKLTKSISDLLKEFNVGISAVKANQMLLDAGILEEKYRPSKSNGTKSFLSLTETGLKYGKNLISPANPRETHPHYYQDSFEDLVMVLEMTTNKDQFE